MNRINRYVLMKIGGVIGMYPHPIGNCVLYFEHADAMAKQEKFALALDSLCDQRFTEIAKLNQTIESMQARIDELMLEHCPEDMTPDQLKNWGDHQKPTQQEAPKTHSTITFTLNGSANEKIKKDFADFVKYLTDNKAG